jgi:hypothetical protein
VDKTDDPNRYKEKYKRFFSQTGATKDTETLNDRKFRQSSYDKVKELDFLDIGSEDLPPEFYEELEKRVNKQIEEESERDSNSSDGEIYKMVDGRTVVDYTKANWRDKAYWRLPKNVRHAVDVAEAKSKHSKFWYRL